MLFNVCFEVTFLSHDISVSMVTRLCAAQSGVQILGRVEIFLFSKMSRLALGPTLPPTQWLQDPFIVVRQLGPLHSSSANIKKESSHSLLYLYATVARIETTLSPHFTLKSYFNRELGKNIIIKHTSSVVRQMPGYNPQRRDRACTLPKFVCCSIYCLFCVVLCIVCA
jgi:hypothetical protein